MTVLAVFRSRSQSLDYADKLREYGVFAETVTTPKEAKIGCGICVRFDARSFVKANAVLKRFRYSAFKGFYKAEYHAGRLVVSPFDVKSLR
ncbi:MAG: DUF3343 domain-containing protein [Clostridia bacterium]|nr:DUF3343 domain-containing protein [Clostridia bacterium]